MNHPSAIATRFLSAALLTTIIITPAAIGQVINEDAKLLAFDGSAGDAFGQSTAINNGIAVIGAYGSGTGAAYIMHQIFDVQPVKLLPNDGVASDLFGYSVDIGIRDIGVGSIVAIVGAPNHSVFGPSSGAVYMFNTTGSLIQKLVPNDGATADNFGVSVAINNGLIVVGVPEDDDNGIDSGSAYLFDATSGQQLIKLLPNDGAANDAFGHKVAISNGIIAISAVRHHNNGIESGAVYIFSALSGMQLGQFSSNEGILFEQFGYSLAIDNGIVAVGALATGTAYTYNASTFAQIKKITPSTPGNAFGWSIDIDGNKVVVGALLDPINGIQSGSGYLFNAFTGIELAKLVPSDGAILEQFGSAMALDNDLAIVGARVDNDNGSNSGSAYLFDLFCPADLNGDGVLNFFDISAFLAAFAAQNPIADFNNDGLFNFFDVSAFLAAFSAGCP